MSLPDKFDPERVQQLYLAPHAGGLIADHLQNALLLRDLTKCKVRIGPLSGMHITITEEDTLDSLLEYYHKHR